MSKQSLWMITEGVGDNVFAVFTSREDAISYTPYLADFNKPWANYYLSELIHVTDERGPRWEVDWMGSVHMRELS